LREELEKNKEFPVILISKYLTTNRDWPKELIDNPTKRAQLGQRLNEVLPRAKSKQIIKVIEELIVR